ATGRIEDLPPGIAQAAVVATPPAGRATTIRQLLDGGCAIIVVEKPLADSYDEGRRIVDACAAAGATLRVNFNRRFDPAYRRFRARLPGRPLALVAVYGKGLRNYASHMIDLVMEWFGPVVAAQALCGQPLGDGDPSIAFRVALRDGPDLIATGIDGIAYDQFELDLYFRDRRFQLANGGAEKRCSTGVSGWLYPSYVHLAPGQLIEPVTPVGGYRELHEAIWQHLSVGTPMPGCTGPEALTNLLVELALRRSAADGGRAVSLLELAASAPFSGTIT
ncbi:MAG TPA: Gfo/Idh/MocA family oxidoreductase, partial [Dehalococcoidia bacterium]|nr:Gfo/Idh/MocA family oxidoreductase [Dehalococcoidia bacterium]